MKLPVSRRDFFYIAGFCLVLFGTHAIAYPEHGFHIFQHFIFGADAEYPLTTCEPSASSKTIEVVFTGSEFQPATITAHLCDTLRFTNQSDIFMEPAVGPHPSHTAYPEFDAQRPLERGETFEMIVRRVGTFSFHDHLHEEIEGQIIIQG